MVVAMQIESTPGQRICPVLHSQGGTSLATARPLKAWLCLQSLRSHTCTIMTLTHDTYSAQ